MNDRTRTFGGMVLAATLLAGTIGCRSLPTPRPAPPTLPTVAPDQKLGERGILLDQMQQLAAEDAQAVSQE